MADTNTIDIQWFGDDHEGRSSSGDPPHRCQVRHAGKPAAFLVDGSTDLEQTGHLDPTSSYRLSRENGRGNAGFHVADAATDDAAVANRALERIDRPPEPGRHDVDVAVQMNAWPVVRSATRPDHVHPRILRGMALVRVGDDVLDVEMMPLQPIAKDMRARFILVAGRVDGRNPYEIARELHDLVGGSIDFVDDAIDGVHGGWKYNTARSG